MISDDIYWIPDDVKTNAQISDLIVDKYYEQQPFDFNLQLDFELKEEEDENQKNIEDEILELLGISEEDLLLEAALQTYDHKLYIEELIEEALQDPKQQPLFTFQTQLNQQQNTETINSSFKTLYERQYLSYSDTTLNIDDEIQLKTKNIQELIQLLQTHCQDKDDLDDILIQINKEQHSKVIHRFCQLRGVARKLVFNYIDLLSKNINEIKNNKSDDKDIELKFNDLLIQNLKNLSLIDPTKSEYLLNRFSEYQLKQMLDTQIPIVRFKILQSIKKDDKLMIEYFELLCQLHPDQVILELQKGGYPQDECLKLCRCYGNLKGLAFLLERSGSVLEAINLQFDLFIQSIKLQLQRNIKLIEAPPELLEIIIAGLQNTLIICRNNSKRNDDESDNNWFQVLIRLTKLRHEFYKIKFTNVLKCFNQVYTILLEEILEKTKIKSLLENLNETMKYFEFQELKATFLQLLSGQQYELAIYGQSTMLIKMTANKYLNTYYEKQLHGTGVDNYCYYCEKHINMVAKVFTECKHTYHIECSQEQLCKQCVQSFPILLRKLLTIFTNRKSTRLMVPTQMVAAQEQQTIQVNVRHQCLNKLKEFDHMRSQLF